jgi:hypothetical protein
MTVHVVYLVNQARKRAVIVDVAEGLSIPEMKAAMDQEMAAFQSNGCIETVAMVDVPKGGNMVTTRLGFYDKNKRGRLEAIEGTFSPSGIR